MNQLLASGKFTAPSTQHLLIECAITSARVNESINIVKSWYDLGKVTDLSGNEIQGLTISTKHKQLIVRRIFSSEIIAQEEKDKYLERLEQEDSSDWTQKTKYFCKAAIPTVDNKQALWNDYFDNEDIDYGFSNFHASF